MCFCKQKLWPKKGLPPLWTLPARPMLARSRRRRWIMARPKKMEEERRDGMVGVRVTAAERVQIERNARMLGISPAEFMRRRSLGYRLPPAVDGQQQTAELAAALLRIGVNLNQLTRHVNAGALPPPDILPGLLTRINALLDGADGSGDHGRREVF